MMKIDPTRSITLRKQFMRGLTRAYSLFQRSLVDLVLVEDAFGLKATRTHLIAWNIITPVGVTTTISTNKRWKYNTQSEAVEQFDKWVQDKINNSVFSQAEAKRWQAYIQKGFAKGTNRAFDDTARSRKAVQDNLRGYGFVEGKREQFVRTSLTRATAIEKLKLLQQRTYSELSGLTDDLKKKLNRTMTDALVRGLTASETAAKLVKVLKISKQRANAIAHTELVRSHAEGQLEAMEQLGVQDVGIVVEWSTAANPCKLCQPLKGIVLKIGEARGMLPRHVFCCCSWVPANLGEDRKEQKRGKYKIDKAISQSKKREEKDTGKDTEWDSADDIARKRTTNILDECDCQHFNAFTKLLATIQSEG